MPREKCATSRLCAAILISTAILAANIGTASERDGDYQSLLVLFADWREFEEPPLLEGAPDYTGGENGRGARATRALPGAPLGNRPERVAN